MWLFAFRCTPFTFCRNETGADKAGKKSGDCAAIRIRHFRRARLSADDRRGAVPESAFEAKKGGFWCFQMAKVCPVQYGRRLAGCCGLWMKRERCKAKSAGEGGRAGDPAMRGLRHASVGQDFACLIGHFPVVFFIAANHRFAG